MLAAAALAAEIAELAAASVLAAVATALGKSFQVSSGIAITVIGFTTAVALGFVAAGLARARRWARTPALLAQFFTGTVGIYLLQEHRYGWGVPTVALAATGLAALLAPASLRAEAQRRRR
jgi:hypothetical protein